MTPVPPPASPCLRVRLIYNTQNINAAGNRFYLSYAGAAPTAGNCATIASDIAAAWNTNLAPLVNVGDALVEVDVLDITTDTGASGQWTGANSGTRGGEIGPVQAALNVEYNISRRYRGGKPRAYFLPGCAADMNNGWEWTSGFISEAETNVPAFFAAVNAIVVGAVGALHHVNLSYYSGFKNITNSSGRERAVPTYRDAALVDSVEGYAVKTIMGSQRRRRTSTSP